MLYGRRFEMERSAKANFGERWLLTNDWTETTHNSSFFMEFKKLAER